MSGSAKRGNANRLNAQKSTGPRTARGKQRASANARAHGVLNAHLLVEGEAPEDYQARFDALVADLRPVGVLESWVGNRRYPWKKGCSGFSGRLERRSRETSV